MMSIAEQRKTKTDQLAKDARARLASACSDADELRNLGLMLGLLVVDPDDPEGRLVEESPYDE